MRDREGRCRARDDAGGNIAGPDSSTCHFSGACATTRPIAASSACDEAPAAAGPRLARDPLSGHYGAPDVARGGLGMADEGERYFASEADVEDEGARLRLIEQASDPTTLAHLDRIGVGAGWRCLEVGAGGGSVAAWLGERVGPTGHVLALGPRPTPPRVDTRAECLDPCSQHRHQ